MPRGLLFSIAFALASLLVLQAYGTTSQEALVVLESFQRLAILSPEAAGEVWMSNSAYQDWNRFLNGLDGEAIGRSLWFHHALVLAHVEEGGAVRGGLYSPWLGALLHLELDEGAATIIDFFVQLVAEPITSAWDAVDLAEQVMASITLGATGFDVSSGPQTKSPGSANYRTLSDRIKTYSQSLEPVYGNSSTGQAVEQVIDRLIAFDLTGPLSLLKTEEEEWVGTLIPVWAATEGDQPIIVLAALGSPLNIVWVEIDDIQEASIKRTSLIRLFDRVTTRGAEDS